MTKSDIQNILQNPYDRVVWIEFLRTILGGSYRNNAPLISIPNNDIADAAYEIGQCTTTDGLLVGVYEVKIKNGISIENKRVALRNLLKSVYKVVDAALIVFDTGEAWRFSYVSEIYTRDEAGNRQQLKTDPKRFTYVLGKGGGVRTATDRFVELSKKSQQIKLKDLSEAFSVEILTKNFYRDLSDWYFWALSKVKFPDDAEPNEEVRNATSVIRLITRLMFVWFLKQKHLVRDELFEEETLRLILKNFNPDSGDDTTSTFYKAILQNLFFATLTTEMTGDQRKFINRQTGVQGFYRYERYFENKELFLELTKETPFLNGGLFENLDRHPGESAEMRIDCFSNRKVNESRLIVPDYLFFGEEMMDLSGVYDDKKRKSVPVKGLINILKSYNFTVEENTPTDIEVALDPELLGKVFENLLASYNPETKTTARKQTGSFYTPREIVEYMVDESLKAYLSEHLTEYNSKGFKKLGSSQGHLFGNEGVKGQLDLVAPIAETTSESIKEALDSLFSYTQEENPFDTELTPVLIRAIDRCRILDPACGSGAFPMGILQRLVFLLRKLDPQNLYWRERQIKRATKDYEQALSLGQTIDLQAQIQEITETFTNNTDDYGRKLYLIENCIYGVDIQPVAVQISKLRFFISLMAEQNPLQQGVNRGIRPLPNLETKFVAANTLIGLEKPAQLLIKNTQIDNLENQLEEVRHKHFFARTPETKKKYRLKDQELRNEIAQLLSKDGWKPTSANQVADWNPYDQSTHAPFFDPERMFGIIDGFDIVIGNPPYLTGSALKDLQKYYKANYKTAQYQLDLYILFMELGTRILRKKGILSYITPNSWLKNLMMSDCRLFILSNYNLLSINPNIANVFESAQVDTLILLGQKTPTTPKTLNQVNIWEYKNLIPATKNTVIQSRFFNNERFVIDVEVDSKVALIIDVIRKNSIKHEVICEITRGVNPYDKYQGQSEEIIKSKAYHSTYKKDDTFVPEIRGRHLSNYSYNWDKKNYISYGSWLAAPRDMKFFEGERLVMRQILSEKLVCTLITEKIIIDQSIFISKLRSQFVDKFNMKYILGVLGSRITSFFFKTVSNEFDSLFPKIKIGEFRELPIPQTSPEAQKPFIQLIDYILQLKKQDKGEAELMAKYFEDVVDGLVYELYFEKELHRAGIYFHKYLQDLPAIHDNNIATVFGELYSPQHPVRSALFKLDTVEEVAIIGGKKK